MQTVACFDVWGTLVIPDKEGFIKHICDNVKKTLEKNSIEVSLETLIKAFTDADRELRERRRRECTLITPEECVKAFLEKALRRPIPLHLVDDVEDIICKAVEENPYVRPADKVHEVLSMFREKGHKLAIVSNIVFWRSAATRRILKRFGIDGFDVEIYADLVREVKPSTKMLRIVENSLNARVIVHVGDSLYEDVSMALAYGVQAIFIDRKMQILSGDERVRFELGGKIIIVRELKDILSIDIENIAR